MPSRTGGAAVRGVTEVSPGLGPPAPGPLGARNYPGTVATFSAVTRQHVLQAIAEYDDRGAEAFLGVYGYERTAPDSFEHEGRSYDSRAVLGVAHRYATGRVASPAETQGGRLDPALILRKHGFEVAGGAPVPATRRAPTTRTAAPRTAAAPRATTSTRRATEDERPAPVCPTCFMTLPATGVCDTCG